MRSTTFFMYTIENVILDLTRIPWLTPTSRNRDIFTILSTPITNIRSREICMRKLDTKSILKHNNHKGNEIPLVEISFSLRALPTPKHVCNEVQIGNL